MFIIPFWITEVKIGTLLKRMGDFEEQLFAHELLLASTALYKKLVLYARYAKMGEPLCASGGTGRRASLRG